MKVKVKEGSNQKREKFKMTSVKKESRVQRQKKLEFNLKLLKNKRKEKRG